MNAFRIYLRFARKYGVLILIHLKAIQIIVSLVSGAPFYVRRAVHIEV